MGFVKKTSVQRFFIKNNLRTSKGLYTALDSRIAEVLTRAGRRAGENRRTTVIDRDI